MGEFDLIANYFTQSHYTDDVIMPIGDDCAITLIQSDQRLAVTTDTLVCGTHFLETISPMDLAYKSVAVNLSDLAAMGASAKWISLAITLPEYDQPWLSDFSQSLFHILRQYNVSLIGGDTTRGHLSLTITAQGVLPIERGLFRHQAKIGDWIFVSGTLGDSAAGLALLLADISSLNADQNKLLTRHLRPTPRLELGQFLLDYSQCAIDISDGLLADLTHILHRSYCGAEIEVDKLPLSSSLLTCYSLEEAEQFALVGGEDYELCFTISNEQKQKFEQEVQKIGIKCTCIGRIVEQQQGLRLIRQGKEIALPKAFGFDHFSTKF